MKREGEVIGPRYTYSKRTLIDRYWHGRTEKERWLDLLAGSSESSIDQLQ